MDPGTAGVVHDEGCVGTVVKEGRQKKEHGNSFFRLLLPYFDRSAMRQPFTGCGTALVTPFRRDGSLDDAGVSRLAKRQIDNGVHFLVPCGTTGESPTLTEEERVRVVELVVEQAKGRVPVLAGAGGYDTQEVIHAAKRMRRAGADGILSVTPYYNKPTPDGLVAHYRAIAEAIELPIILYNVPGRTGCNIDPATLVRLAS